MLVSSLASVTAYANPVVSSVHRRYMTTVNPRPSTGVFAAKKAPMSAVVLRIPKYRAAYAPTLAAQAAFDELNPL